MKIIIFLTFLLFSFASLSKDKIESYSVPSAKPTIKLFDSKTESEVQKKPSYSLLLTRGNLDFNLPTYSDESLDFSPFYIGIAASKHYPNFSKMRGHFEIGGEGLRFERKRAGFSQKLNLLFIHIFQNFDYSYFSLGMGLSPIYLTAEQGALSPSLSTASVLAALKVEFKYPLNDFLKLEMGGRLHFGKIKNKSLSLLTFLIGVSYE